MCREVFYISPFKSELTAAIIGQSLTPAILPGTWGVNGVTFFQNNKVHQDAGSAFQHPDTEPRWDISDTLGSPFCCSMHLPVTATCSPCHQRPSPTLPVVATSSYWYGTVNGATSQPITCYVAPLLWTRKRTGLYLAHPEVDRGIACVTACSFILLLAKNLLPLNHCCMLSGTRFLCLHNCLCQHGQTRRSTPILSKGSKVTAQ